MEGISILGAFVAGLISFLSPCVLPLVPGYISMLSGIGVEQLKEGKTPRGGLLWSALAFVIGFSVVFISFGVSARAGCGRPDPYVRPASHRLAREDFDSSGTYARSDSRSGRRLVELSSRHVGCLPETDSFLFSLAYFSPWTVSHALAQS